ncbi:helix-turn-helix transcriptional regulator [Paenibacillus shunpengii]|uniref:Helix-turn-helix transcriptional regulator n=2 Tax=Paenibacillus TaxID=44249 RepID=A0ABW5SMH1_9BACL
MAKLCCMSERYFMKFFKSVMGKTFIHYLNYVRLSEAEKLLLSSELTITEAALQSGFNDPSYFVLERQLTRYGIDNDMVRRFRTSRQMKNSP